MDTQIALRSREEMEKKFSQTVSNVSLSKVAKVAGLGDKTVQGWFCHTNPRPNPLIKYLAVQKALDAECPDTGNALWVLVSAFRELNRPATNENLCPSNKIGLLTKEVADVASGRLNNIPIVDLLKEVAEAKAVLSAVEQSLINQEAERQNAIELAKLQQMSPREAARKLIGRK